jgi:hypothetical protein
MPRQYLKRYGVEQTRRRESHLFPSELCMREYRFTLERDGLHMGLRTDHGTTPIVLDRGCVASLMNWLQEERVWVEQDGDPAYDTEDDPTACGFCFRNLAHTSEQHQACIEETAELRAPFADARKEKQQQSGRNNRT